MSLRKGDLSLRIILSPLRSRYLSGLQVTVRPIDETNDIITHIDDEPVQGPTQSGGRKDAWADKHQDQAQDHTPSSGQADRTDNRPADYQGAFGPSAAPRTTCIGTTLQRSTQPS